MSVALAVIGLILTAAGFYGSQTARPPFDALSAILAPLGMGVAIIGVLLLAVPNFFSS